MKNVGVIGAGTMGQGIAAAICYSWIQCNCM